MDPRISLVTLGVADLARASAFYEALGWTQGAEEKGVAAFNLLGQTLGLYPIEKLAEDLGISADEFTGFSGITFGHNVPDRETVDATMALAEAAGARIVRPSIRNILGRLYGILL